MQTGKQIRLGRLFNADTGSTVIVAIDHGLGGQPTGLADIRMIAAAVPMTWALGQWGWTLKTKYKKKVRPGAITLSPAVSVPGECGLVGL